MYHLICFILHLVINVINDYISQSIDLYASQVVFYRFLFASITLIPFIDFRLLKVNYSIHIFRGFLLLFGLLCWVYGLRYVNLTSAISIGFTTPIFIVFFERFFKFTSYIDLSRFFIILLGFIGIFLAVYNDSYSFSYTLIIFLVATMCFAILDLLTKYIVDDHIFTAAFNTYFTITLTMLVYIIYYDLLWISWNNLFYCLILGISSNIIIYLLTIAYSYDNPSVFGAYRYIEILLALGIQYFVLNSIPSIINFIGILIIILSVVLNFYCKLLLSRK